MGDFDMVECVDPRFVCSEGHRPDGHFQTKDLGQTRGGWQIVDGRLTGEFGGQGEPVARPISGRLTIYTDCHECPAFIQGGTNNVITCWVEFEVEVVDDEVRSVTRVSPSTAEYLEQTPQEPWMKWTAGGEGPMSFKTAIKRCRDLRGH